LHQQQHNSNDIDKIIGTCTKYGGSMIPRVAAMIQPPVSPVTDMIQIVDETTFIRPIYAGNALAKVQVNPSSPLNNKNIQVLSIRPTSFEKAPYIAYDANAVSIKEYTMESYPYTTFVQENVTKLDRPDLSNASIVISGGRGMKSGDNFHTYLEPLADVLQPHAAVGASRAAVDAGMVSNDYQVGQMGKVVAPNLYIAIGISGSIQHISGTKDSKAIVTINKDPDAPIVQISIYTLIGDLFTIVPELTE
jgi:electron transfer flavoprotein alpha subunit